MPKTKNKVAQTIKIQPLERPNMVMPYPYFIGKDGMVGRQDFWKGEPLKLMGFCNSPIIGRDIKLSLRAFLLEPTDCIGLFPVFAHANGHWFTYQDAIESVTVNK